MGWGSVAPICIRHIGIFSLMIYSFCLQEFIAGHKEPVTNSYSKLDMGLRSYPQLPSTAYPSSSLAAQSLGGYGSSGVGGYGSYRL